MATQNAATQTALYEHQSENTSADWLAAVLAGVADGVIAADAQGHIKFMNAVAERLTGWAVPEALGRPLIEIGVPAVACTNQAVEQAGVMLMLVARDGSQRTVGHRRLSVPGPSGAEGDSVIILHPLGPNQPTQDNHAEIETLRRELRGRTEEMEGFVHSVAHALSNPLEIISGYTEILNQDYATLPEADRRKYLRIIGRNARKLNNVIKEMVLLAGIGLPDVDVICLELDMDAIVAEVQGRLADLIEEQRAELIRPAAWPVARGYPAWIEEVWVNYISNAIKYGGRPPRIELGADAQPNGSVRFWVRDNGPGIAQQDLARLFTPFTRLNQIRAKGHGLGLSVVRRIVEKLGGQVEVTSQPGQGSVFGFTLPGATTG